MDDRGRILQIDGRQVKVMGVSKGMQCTHYPVLKGVKKPNMYIFYIYR